MIWCVRTDDDGRFKYAKPRHTAGPSECILIAWSLDEWAARDQAAADQFTDPDGHRQLQAQFNVVTGLDRPRSILADSLGELLARYR